MSPLLLPLLCLPLGAAPASTKAPPNFVLLIADDMGDTECAAFGNPAVKAPNITKLAADGLRFDRAFIVSSSCSPSRCSMITGRYPHSHGAPRLHQPLPKDQITLVELLRKAGYWTAIAGKTHIGADALKKFDVVKEKGGPSGCEQWVATLRERPKDKPFLAWLAAHDPHRPYQANTIPVPHKPADVVVPPFLPDNAATRKDLAMFYDEIARLDGFVGDVLAELEKQGIAENTVVLFLSDNGRPFPRCKTTLYDSGTRTPMIVRWPAKVKPGGVTASLVNSIDIAPTFLTLAGAPVPETVQGKSFAAILEDPAAKTQDFIVTEKNWHDFDDHARAVRTAKFKYIRNSYTDIPLTPPADAVKGITYQEMIKLNAAGKLPPEQRISFVTPRPAEELYDLDADPNEFRNVAADSKYAEQLKEMRAILDRWVKDTNDRVPAQRTPDGFDRTTGNAVGKKGKGK